jgi:hypothetical protein
MRDTIEMVREAGWTSYDSQDERFKTLVELVRADEREVRAVVVENIERNGDWITKAEAAEAIRATGETK